MASELNPRIEINNRATLSSDGCRIVRALTIDGISYDIDIDFSKGRSVHEDLQLIPKIQAIWARMAEQTLPTRTRVPANWQMECSYDSSSKKASVFVISAGGKKEDKTNAISFSAVQLQKDLNEASQFLKDYAGFNGTCTAHRVMEYVDFLMNRSSYCFDESMPLLSAHIRKATRRQSKNEEVESSVSEDSSS